MATKAPLLVQAQEQFLAGAVRSAPAPFPVQLRRELDAAPRGVAQDPCVDQVKILYEYSPTTASQNAR